MRTLNEDGNLLSLAFHPWLGYFLPSPRNGREFLFMESLCLPLHLPCRPVGRISSMKCTCVWITLSRRRTSRLTSCRTLTPRQPPTNVVSRSRHSARAC